jgi:hypothetical protein
MIMVFRGKVGDNVEVGIFVGVLVGVRDNEVGMLLTVADGIWGLRSGVNVGKG